MPWREEFPAWFRVPREVEVLAREKYLEDTSWRNDAAPSFGTKLRDGRWLRLWVEHPNPAFRRGWALRFTVLLQDDPSSTDGRTLAATENLEDTLWCLERTLRELGRGRVQIRFVALMGRRSRWVRVKAFRWIAYHDDRSQKCISQLQKSIRWGAWTVSNVQGA